MRILISVDTEKEAANLFERISNFITKIDAEHHQLTIYHSYELPVIKGKSMVHTSMEVIQQEKKFHQNTLNKIRKKLEQEISGLNINCSINSLIETGDFLPTIKAHIEKEKYDLLILLPTERDSLEKFFRKSKVFYLVDELELPILVLPKSSEKLKKQKIIGLIRDALSLENITKTNLFKSIGNKHKKLVHFGSEDKLDSELEIEFYKTENSFETFKKFNKENPDSIYILNHKKNEGMDRFFRKSFTKRLLNMGEIDMIII